CHLRGQRQRRPQPWQDTDGVRLRRPQDDRIADDGFVTCAPSDGHEWRAPRKPILYTSERAAGRIAAAARDKLSMTERAPPSSESPMGRLHRCIRDLAALNALPSMCVGRSPDEALEVVMDALPTALDCELVLVTLPGSPPRERARLAG